MVINWEAVNAIGSIFGSLATFAAVIVALWQTSLKSKKILKFSFSPNVVGIGNTGTGNDAYIHLAVTNNGQHRIKINSWGILLNGDQKLALMSTCMGIFGDDLPFEIEPDQTADLFFIKNILLKRLKNCVDEGSLNKNSKLYFYVTDKTNKKYIFNTKYKINSLISFN